MIYRPAKASIAWVTRYKTPLSRAWHRLTPSRANHTNGASGEDHLLPQELVDYIIDYLHDDKPALLRCSLVSHRWLPSARLHLFDITIVQGNELLNQFFTDVQSSKHIGMCAYIRRLHLDGHHQNRRATQRFVVQCEVIARLLANLPNLKVLHFLSLNFTDVTSPLSHKNTLPSLPSRRYKLEELVIKYCGCYNLYHRLEDFLQIINLFSEITSLHVAHTSFSALSCGGLSAIDRDLGRLSSATMPKDLLVNTLTIVDAWYPTAIWLSCLGHTASVNSLTSVRVLGVSHWHANVLGKLLQKVGARLWSLHMNFTGLSEDKDGPTLCRALNLSACTRLMMLIIHLNPLNNSAMLSWQTLCNVIASLGAISTLRTVVIHHPYDRVVAHPQASLDLLQATLATFTSLQTVIFIDRASVVDTAEDRRSAEMSLRDRFPALAGRVSFRLLSDFDGDMDLHALGSSTKPSLTLDVVNRIDGQGYLY